MATPTASTQPAPEPARPPTKACTVFSVLPSQGGPDASARSADTATYEGTPFSLESQLFSSQAHGKKSRFHPIPPMQTGTVVVLVGSPVPHAKGTSGRQHHATTETLDFQRDEGHSALESPLVCFGFETINPIDGHQVLARIELVKEAHKFLEADTVELEFHHGLFRRYAA